MRELQNPIAGLLVPGVQAAISGLVIGLVVGIANRDWEMFFLGFSMALCGAWFFLIFRWSSLAADIVKNRPGRQEPKDLAQLPTIRVMVSENDGRSGVFAEVQATPDQLVQMARLMSSGATFSESALCGRGRPFSKSQFHRLRDAFLARGLAQWRDPYARQQGIELSRPGRAVISYLSTVDAPPELSQVVNHR